MGFQNNRSAQFLSLSLSLSLFLELASLMEVLSDFLEDLDALDDDENESDAPPDRM